MVAAALAFLGLPRRFFTSGTLLLSQVCVFSFVDLFLHCLGCETWLILHLVLHDVLGHGEDASDGCKTTGYRMYYGQRNSICMGKNIIKYL